jgi:hypothetical protein
MSSLEVDWSGNVPGAACKTNKRLQEFVGPAFDYLQTIESGPPPASTRTSLTGGVAMQGWSSTSTLGPPSDRWVA